MENRAEGMDFKETKNYPTAAWGHVDAMEVGGSEMVKGRQFLENLMEAVEAYNQQEQRGN